MTRLTQRVEIRTTPAIRRLLDIVCEYYALNRSEFLRRTVEQQYNFITGQDPEGVQNAEEKYNAGQ